MAQKRTHSYYHYYYYAVLLQSKATNPYLRCGNGSGKRCAVPHAINDVCESIVAARFQFFCLFCLIFEKKVKAPNESKLTHAVFIHEQPLIAILPLRGKK